MRLLDFLQARDYLPPGFTTSRDARFRASGRSIRILGHVVAAHGSARPKRPAASTRLLSCVKRSDHAVILTRTQIYGRDRLAFRNERATQHLRLAVVVDVLIRLALEDVPADRDSLIELAALKRQIRLGGHELIALPKKIDHAFAGRCPLRGRQRDEDKRRGKDSSHAMIPPRLTLLSFLCIPPSMRAERFLVWSIGLPLAEEICP
jgi:hypothetical protein